MTSAPISEIRAMLARIRNRNCARWAIIEFSLDLDGELKAHVATGDGGELDRTAVATLPDETDAERKAGHLAYPRRVTVAMQALEDEVTKPVPFETEE